MTPRPYTPRPYQHIMQAHMYDNPRGALWVPMGFGKTVTGLTVLDALDLTVRGPALAIAPKRVARSTWPNEVKKWQHLAHMEVSPIIGSPQERIAALKRDASLYTINPDNLPWLVEHVGKRKWPFPKVIFDEATRLKSMRASEQTSTLGKKFIRVDEGRRAGALARVAHTHIKHFIEFTGTPAPNGLKDLWAQLWFLDMGARLGRTYTSFEQRWFRVGFDGYALEPLPFAQEQIQTLCRDLCLALKVEDWFDIQKPIVNRVNVDLPSKARKIYRDMEKEMFAQIGQHGVEAFSAAAKTMKCLQLASGVVWVESEKRISAEVHDMKLQALESIRHETAGEPLLISYQWIPSRERILKAFPKARWLDDDPKTEDDWNAGKIPELVAHPASCGHGLNLQDGGHILVNYDHWWNLEERDQILERIGPVRQAQAGHSRPVYVYDIIAADTVDEDVLERHATKRSVQDILLDAVRRRG